MRALEHRPHQLHWFSGPITRTYLRGTSEGVRAFRHRHHLGSSGQVDRRTWDELMSLTKKPTRAELHTVLRAGPAQLERVGWNPHHAAVRHRTGRGQSDRLPLIRA